MRKFAKVWTGLVIISLLSLTMVAAGEQSANQPTPSGTNPPQSEEVPWATDLPQAIFPSGVPRSPAEVDLLSLTANTLAEKVLTGEKPLVRLPVFVDDVPQEGSIEYGYRCNRLVNAAWDLWLLYPDRPLSEDPSELLNSPTLLWRLKYLEPVGPARRDSLLTIVKGMRSISSAKERYEVEVGKSLLKPGQFMLVFDSAYPDVNLGTPAMVVCRPDPEKETAQASAVWLQTKESFEQTDWARFRRALYWGSILSNLLQGAAIYYNETGGKMPKSREDFAAVLGPENPKAWNPAVAKFIEKLLPRLTPAMFRRVSEYEAILEKVRRTGAGG